MQSKDGLLPNLSIPGKHETRKLLLFTLVLHALLPKTHQIYFETSPGHRSRIRILWMLFL